MTILGFADMLLADWNNAGNHAHSRQYLERIRNAASRQSSIIGKLEHIAALNRQPLQPQQVDIGKIFSAVAQAMIDPATNIRVNVTASGNVVCDPQIMEIAISNLLANAIALAKNASAPEIEFGVNVVNSSPVFHVRNNGTGFDLGTDPTLLALFRRLQAGQEFTGAGIGLLIATAIVYRHGGKLWITTNRTSGTDIYFKLSNQ
jgi:light-regulated signal transduction histidine kinase (bacteriophytochrome)